MTANKYRIIPVHKISNTLVHSAVAFLAFSVKYNRYNVFPQLATADKNAANVTEETAKT